MQIYFLFLLEKARINQYEIDIHNLNKELNQAKDDERKRSQELDRHKVSLVFLLIKTFGVST